MLNRARSSCVVPLGEKSATKSPTALISGNSRGLVGPVWVPVAAPAAPRVGSEGGATGAPRLRDVRERGAPGGRGGGGEELTERALVRVDRPARRRGVRLDV